MINTTAMTPTSTRLRNNYPWSTPLKINIHLQPAVRNWLESRTIDWQWQNNYTILFDDNEPCGLLRFAHKRDQFLFELTWSRYVFAE